MMISGQQLAATSAKRRRAGVTPRGQAELNIRVSAAIALWSLFRTGTGLLSPSGIVVFRLSILNTISAGGASSGGHNG